MPHPRCPQMKLTATEVRNAKPRSKTYRLFDGEGLYLEVTPRGGTYWRLKYRFGGKEKRLALGVYPAVTLAKARKKKAEARELLHGGTDPAADRAAQASEHQAAADTFECIAREWFDKNAPRWRKSHSDKVIRRLELNVFPWLGGNAIAKLTAPEVLAMLRRIESRGALDTAHRTMQNCSQVFRYAVATGRAERDPTQDLRGALAPVKHTHYASVREPKEVAELLRAIEGFTGTMPVRTALRLLPLVFVRPGELRGARWAEFDLEAAEWRIPGERMKRGVPHIVPLATQVVAMLRELEPLTGRGELLFPGVRTRTKPMSENTLNAGLRRLGYSSDQMTAHGFRSIASTLLNEQGWNRDAIERQLAHADSDSVRAAYNYAEHLGERRKMMQAWADYLDGLKRGADVVPIKRAG